MQEGRLEGFAPHVATGIANNARIRTIKMTQWLLVRIICFIRFVRSGCWLGLYVLLGLLGLY